MDSTLSRTVNTNTNTTTTLATIRQSIMDHFLSQKGMKCNNNDLKSTQRTYYGYSIGSKSVYTSNANSLMILPDHLLNYAIQHGHWCIYMGDEEGGGNSPLIRTMLRDSYFREYVPYDEFITQDCRHTYIHSMELEIKNTQESFDGFYNTL